VKLWLPCRGQKKFFRYQSGAQIPQFSRLMINSDNFKIPQKEKEPHPHHENKSANQQKRAEKLIEFGSSSKSERKKSQIA
jgi:hypothetical protein